MNSEIRICHSDVKTYTAYDLGYISSSFISISIEASFYLWKNWGASPPTHTNPSGSAKATDIHWTYLEFKSRQPKIVPSVGSLLPPAKNVPNSHWISTFNHMTRKINQLQMAGFLYWLPSKKCKKKSLKEMKNFLLAQRYCESINRRTATGHLQFYSMEMCSKRAQSLWKRTDSLAGWVFHHLDLGKPAALLKSLHFLFPNLNLHFPTVFSDSGVPSKLPVF